MSTAQLAFDIDTLIHQAAVDAAPAWNGAPLRYHEEYRTPAELDTAWERWVFEHGTFGCVPSSHMWHRDRLRDGFEFEQAADGPVHGFAFYTADTRCSDWGTDKHRHDHAAGELPDELMHQIICAPCQWRAISHNENTVVEAWHDHALEGWRELPVIPRKLAEHDHERNKLAKLNSWLEEHYPTEWRKVGYPVITERHGIGTRHVPGRSPFGGYDLSHTAL